MNQHPPSPIQAFLNKGIAQGKMLNDIFPFEIINFDHGMLDVSKGVAVERQPQDGEDMGHVGCLAEGLQLLA